MISLDVINHCPNGGWMGYWFWVILFINYRKPQPFAQYRHYYMSHTYLYLSKYNVYYIYIHIICFICCWNIGTHVRISLVLFVYWIALIIKCHIVSFVTYILTGFHFFFVASFGCQASISLKWISALHYFSTEQCSNIDRHIQNWH